MTKFMERINGPQHEIALRVFTLIVLAIIVLVRTVLSLSIDVEIDGRWPWQAARQAGRAYATADDLTELYGVEPGRITVVPLGADPPGVGDEAQVEAWMERTPSVFWAVTAVTTASRARWAAWTRSPGGSGGSRSDRARHRTV